MKCEEDKLVEEEGGRTVCQVSPLGINGEHEGTHYDTDKNQQRNEAIKGSERQCSTERLEAWEDGEDGDLGILLKHSDGTLVYLH